MSHTQKYVAYIFSQNIQVGIDIELIRENSDYSSLSHMIYSPSEKGSLPSKNKEIHFYKTWTLKEAFLKAVGIGLIFPPEKVSTVINGDNLDIPIIPDSLSGGNTSWTFKSLKLDGHMGACAINEHEVEIFQHEIKQSTKNKKSLLIKNYGEPNI
jgi:4'-phosphopantetheinyl transferase